ncbi:hypothetical protein VTO58DRAFT_103371 [Aureobasidium pullulans]
MKHKFLAKAPSTTEKESTPTSLGSGKEKTAMISFLKGIKHEIDKFLNVVDDGEECLRRSRVFHEPKASQSRVSKPASSSTQSTVAQNFSRVLRNFEPPTAQTFELSKESTISKDPPPKSKQSKKRSISNVQETEQKLPRTKKPKLSAVEPKAATKSKRKLNNAVNEVVYKKRSKLAISSKGSKDKGMDDELSDDGASGDDTSVDESSDDKTSGNNTSNDDDIFAFNVPSNSDSDSEADTKELTSQIPVHQNHDDAFWRRRD